MSFQTQFSLVIFVIIKKFQHSLQGQGQEERRTPLTFESSLKLRVLRPLQTKANFLGGPVNPDSPSGSLPGHGNNAI